MYTPAHFAMPDADVRAVLASAETAQLVTAHAEGPQATLLPVVWCPDAEGYGRLQFHVTRVNPVWKRERLGQALAILDGPDGYIHPDWYASNADAPSVPTWNYVTVHAYGDLIVHDDPDWVLAHARELSDRFGYDSGRVAEAALGRMARAIVGVELPIARVEAKAKLNQNRSPADVAGAIAGLRATGHDALADEMRRVALPHAEARFALVDEVRDRKAGAGA